MSKSKKPKFYITHLYPRKMNIYGDIGNIIAINHHLQKFSFEPVYQEVEVGDNLPEKTDFYFIGGGQDEQQFEIFKDLVYKRKTLLDEVEKGTPLLSICGGYQLLGKKFVTGEGLEIDGIGLFDIETKAPSSNVKERCVGNLIIECSIPDLEGKKFVGFENHSGQTFITDPKRTKPLGKVLVGFGNSFKKDFEGAVYKNAIGTYMHGSCLPKNPDLANFLILQSIRKKTENYQIDPSIYLELIKNPLEFEIAKKTNHFLISKFS